MKLLMPLVAALLLSIAATHWEQEGGCSCQTPLFVLVSPFGCSDNPQAGERADKVLPVKEADPKISDHRSVPKVTFVEIGSVNCVPCRMMQPVIRSVEEQFGSQIRVVFHDVWTPEGRVNARKYGARVIPTQVFLDSEGREYFRHEGFFPKEEVVRVLNMKGVR